MHRSIADGSSPSRARAFASQCRWRAVPAQARGRRSRRSPDARRRPVRCPPGYVIGADDVLSIVFWRDKDMSAERTVRPDGKISLPLLNDVQAAGLTPEQLRDSITEAADAVHRGPERHGGRPADQQPEGLHHRRGQQARALPADAARRRCCS